LRVTDSQKTYTDVGSNSDALAYAYNWMMDNKPIGAFAVYAGEEVVGLMIYVYEIVDDEEYFKNLPCFEKNTCWIDYCMIDEKHQGKGYGKQAFEKLLEDIKAKPHGDADHIMIKYGVANERARNLY